MTVIQKYTDEYLLSFLADGSKLQAMYKNEISLYEAISLVIQLSQHEVLEDSGVLLETISVKQ